VGIFKSSVAVEL